MVRAYVKLLVLVLWILIFYPFVWLAAKTRKDCICDRLMQLCQRGMLRICEVSVTQHGNLSPARPLLVVSNHVSYVDIPILGSIDGSIRFTPKSDIAGWPFIGNVCRMIRCVFIDRRPSQLQSASKGIAGALARGEVVSLFPEATTGNGVHLVDFKSGFFSLAEEKINGQFLQVQPAAIVYRSVRRLPIDITQWPSIAWYGDMDLVPHLITFLSLGNVSAEIYFLPPVTAEIYTDRKKMAAYCQEAIAQRMNESRQEKLPVHTRRFSISSVFSRSKL